MSISRRELYAAGEPLGQGATRREGGRLILGDGGDSSSSNATSTQDNRMVVGDGGGGVAGVSGSGNTITIAPTDSGAVAMANSVITTALQGNAFVADKAITSNTFVADKAMDTTTENLRLSLAASAAAMQDAIASANASASMAVGAANESADRVASISDKSQGYAWESASNALGMTKNVVDFAFEQNYNSNKMALDTVKNVADAYQTARNTEVTAQFQDYRYILVAGLLVVGVVAFRAMGR